MMQYTDPTYLRYIYDGLSFDSIHKDNIAALPDGLIGMYEEALPYEQNVNARNRFLSFFSVWALLKKEVSIVLVADLLDWEEQAVIDYLSVYTKWFNSPVSGKYLLYHERLRVFLLEKITAQQLDLTNKTIINKCRLALEKQNGDEWEVYALEYLPSHLLISAMQNEHDGELYKSLVYDTTFWNRQLEISKGYDWSKKMLTQTMSWAAKQNTDELIECALNKVDLHHMEQNDAPRIVELVAQNDIDTALQRIESFGGNDKEGLQRKFILYMLCLMEMTLLDSKDKPFRQEGIEKLLKHFDENMPIDITVFNCFDIIPFNFICILSFEIESNNIDSIVLFHRGFLNSTQLNFDSFFNTYLFSNLSYKLLIRVSQLIKDIQDRDKFISNLSISLLKNKEYKLSFKTTLKIIDTYQKTNTSILIAEKLFESKKDYIANKLLLFAFNCACEIDNDFSRIEMLLKVAESTNKNSFIEKLLVHVNQYLGKIKNDPNYYLFFLKISFLYDKINHHLVAKKWKSKADRIYSNNRTEIEISYDLLELVENPYTLVDQIIDSYDKSICYIRLSNICQKRGNLYEAKIAIRKSRFYAKKVRNKYDQSQLMVDILEKCIEFNLIDIVEKEVINLKPYHQSSVLKRLSIVFCNKGLYNEAFQVANKISNDKDKIVSILNIYLIKHKSNNKLLLDNNKKDIFSIAFKSTENSSELFVCLIETFSNNKLYKDVYNLFFEMINYLSNKKSNQDKILIDIISKHCLKITNESLEILIKNINDAENVSSIYFIIARQFQQNGYLDQEKKILFKIEEIINGSDDIDFKIQTSLDLAEHYIKSREITKAKKLLKKALKFINQSDATETWEYELENDFNFKRVAKLYIELECYHKSLNLLNSIIYPLDRIEIILKIIDFYYDNWSIKKVINQLDISFEILEEINEIEIKIIALCKISTLFFQKGNELISNNTLSDAINLFQQTKKQKAIQQANILLSISETYFNRNDFENGKYFLESAIKKVPNNEELKVDIYKKICSMLIEKNYLELFENYVHKISNRGLMENLLTKYGEKKFNDLGFYKSMSELSKSNILDFKKFYFLGIIQSFKINDVTIPVFLQVLPWIRYDTERIKHLLYLYSIQYCLFEDCSQININRINKSLDLKWILFIKQNILLA